MAENASTLLASHAQELSRAIFKVIVGKRRLRPSDLDDFCVAGEIAARLHLIATSLRSLPPYWIDSEVDQLCSTVLRDLQAIGRPMEGSRVWSSVASLLGRNESDAETCIVTFFRWQKENARILKGACDDLLNKSTQSRDDAEEVPSSALQTLDTPEMSANFNSGLFKALQLIAECNPALHSTSRMTAAVEQGSQTLWHPARLCLHDSPPVRILVPAMDLTVWQEFCLRKYVDPVQWSRLPIHAVGSRR